MNAALPTASRADRAALWLSRIFHPFVILLPSLLWIGHLSGLSLAESLTWMGLLLGILVVPMFAFLWLSVRAGRYENEDVPVRERRLAPYLLGLAMWVVLSIVLNRARAPRVILACLYAALLTQVVAMLVNAFTKVSVHAIASGGCAAVLLALSPAAGAVLAAIALLVGWARVRLGQHTPGQVLLGWAIVGACVATVFTVYV